MSVIDIREKSMVQIYGTLGPACKEQSIQEQMFRAGLTGMRLNLSHTGLKDSAEIVHNFMQAARTVGVPAQLLIDMQGPELRVGEIKEALELKCNETVILSGKVIDKCIFHAHIPVPPSVINALEKNDEVLLNDGKLSLRVEKVFDATAECTVIRGGTLTSHKSVKIVGKQVDMLVLTKHDIENLRLAKEYGVTGLMQPFVRSGKDLEEVRKQLKQNRAEHVKIFAKIENRIALDHLDSILKEADVIIIARGDLGNDMELWELPAVQKKIEKACKMAGKPFIVVTQMLASMETSPVPTRAEVSDIFNAVADGAYGVMITGESAVGQYPVEAVKYLANTARSAKAWMNENME